MKIGVAIFCYKRHEKFSKLLESLSKNNLAEIHKFYVYQDGLQVSASLQDKNEHEKIKNEWVKFAEKEINGDYYFKTQKTNIGLRESILSGVDKALCEVDAIVILEDDLILHPLFMEKMIYLLKKYSKDEKVGHINGWSNFQFLRFSSRNDIIRTTMMYCWGWGTWRNRWIRFRQDDVWTPREFSLLEFIKYDYFGLARLIHQLKINWNGKKKTWAVFWYLYLRLNNLKSVGYKYSLTKNAGNDGSGDNCKDVNSQYFSFLTDGDIYKKNKFTLNESSSKNLIYYLNIIIWLTLRNAYLLFKKLMR